MAMRASTTHEPVDLITRRDRDGAPFDVRAYQPSDREALQQFYEQFEPKRTAQGLPPSDPERIREWLTFVLASGIHMLAFREQKLIGHALVMPTARDEVGEYAVFLEYQLRGHGIGTELARVIIDVASAAGLSGLWLTVEPRNRAAIRSYEKAGFHFIPETIYSLEAEMELPLTKKE